MLTAYSVSLMRLGMQQEGVYATLIGKEWNVRTTRVSVTHYVIEVAMVLCLINVLNVLATQR